MGNIFLSIFKHHMLLGVDTPKIDIPFSITIDKACKRSSLELFDFLFSKTKRNSLLSFPKFQYE